MTICAVDRRNPELPQGCMGQCACLNNLYEEADAFEDEEGLTLTDVRGSTGEGKDLSDREREELESHSVGNHWPKCSHCPTWSRAVEVKQAMESQLALIDALSHPNLPQEQSVLHSVTVRYDPQSNGSAERSVSICKGLVRRLLIESGLKDVFWSYAFRHSTTALLLQALCDADSRQIVEH
eukprot:4621142-Amphidinium_carterae.1